MYLSLNYVKEYVKLPVMTPKELGLAITISTVEVEGVVDRAESFKGIVVGKILEVTQHPNADRLIVCRVDIKSEVLQVVCGGTNLRQGMLVAVATVGSKVKWHGEGEPIVMEKAKIRGVESFGMIAASSELGLEKLLPQSSDREILDLSGYDVRVGEPLAQALGIDDVVFEIDNKSMTHRPDLWSQYGLAREVAAIYSAKLKPLRIPPIAFIGAAMPLTVTVAEPERCPRYVAVVIDNVTVRPSPWWLQRDLDALGIKPINTVVDVTNYIMVTLGQPMHAFDYARLHDMTLTVGGLKKAQDMETLAGKKYTVPVDTLMINDGQGPVAIAGIVGGTGSQVRDTTKTIVFESATFNATSIRRSATALGLRTDASARFEKKLDPTLPPIALAAAVDLLRRIDPGVRVASEVVDVVQKLHAQPVITVTKEFIDTRLGTVLSSKEIANILKRLEFEVAFKKDQFTITVPTFRAYDVTIPEAIVEEVARIHGYHKIPATMPTAGVSKPVISMQSRVDRDVRMLLARSFGYDELLNYSFADPVWTERMDLTAHRVSVKNPLASEQKYLRTSLLPQLIARSIDNLRWGSSGRFFEIGRTFSKEQGEYAVDAERKTFLPKQPIMLAGISIMKKGDVHSLYREVKGHLTTLFEYLGIDATMLPSERMTYASNMLEIKAHTVTLGALGTLRSALNQDDLKDVALVWWEIDFDKLVKLSTYRRVFKSLPRFPFVIRDIAFVLDVGIPWSDIEQSVAHASPFIRSVELFDVFESPKLGEQMKSMAIRFTLGSDERTLTSADVESALQRVTAIVKDTWKAGVR